MPGLVETLKNTKKDQEKVLNQKKNLDKIFQSMPGKEVRKERELADIMQTAREVKDKSKKEAVLEIPASALKEFISSISKISGLKIPLPDFLKNQ